MLVTWDPLPDEFTNGQLLWYIVYLRFYKNEYEWYDDGEFGRSINVSSSETYVILDDIDGGRRYQVSVAAFTVDVGPKSNWETFMVGKCVISSTLVPPLLKLIVIIDSFINCSIGGGFSIDRLTELGSS